MAADLGASVNAPYSRRYVEGGARLALRDPVRDFLRHTLATIAYRAPVRSESFARSDIVAGRLGTEQTKSQFEFD